MIEIGCRRSDLILRLEPSHITLANGQERNRWSMSTSSDWYRIHIWSVAMFLFTRQRDLTGKMLFRILHKKMTSPKGIFNFHKIFQTPFSSNINSFFCWVVYKRAWYPCFTSYIYPLDRGQISLSSFSVLEIGKELIILAS